MSCPIAGALGFWPPATTEAESAAIAPAPVKASRSYVEYALWSPFTRVTTETPKTGYT
jgi:hypothetical protein